MKLVEALKEVVEREEDGWGFNHEMICDQQLILNELVIQFTSDVGPFESQLTVSLVTF